MKGQFSASDMSRVARQAAKFRGLSTVGSYDVVSNVVIVDPDRDVDLYDVVVIRAYSPSGSKVVDITADDIYTMATMYQEAPMARLA